MADAPLQTEKAHTEPTWCVHVLGPDDVLVQPDRAAAVREAHALNTWVASKTDAELNDPMNPTIWAVVTTLEANP